MDGVERKKKSRYDLISSVLVLTLSSLKSIFPFKDVFVNLVPSDHWYRSPCRCMNDVQENVEMLFLLFAWTVLSYDATSFLCLYTQLFPSILPFLPASSMAYSHDLSLSVNFRSFSLFIINSIVFAYILSRSSFTLLRRHA